MIRCLKCGMETERDDARFCSGCGSPLGPDRLDEQDTLKRNEADLKSRYAQAVASAMSDGVLDAEDRRVLDETREDLRITPSEAVALENQAMANLLVEAEDSEEKEDVPVRLDLNDNHFYMEGCVSVLDLRLTNLSDKVMTGVDISIQGNYLGSSDCRVNLPGRGKKVRQNLEIRPTVAGEHVIHLKIHCHLGDERLVYASQVVLKVLHKDETPSSVTLVIDQRMQAGRNIGYGMSVQNEVKDGVAKGMIRTANDLLLQPFPERWQQVLLTYDEEATRRLCEGPDAPIRLIKVKQAASVALDRLSLAVEGGETGKVLLLAGPKLRLGRNRDNDIMLRVLPRSAANDKLSCQISGCHVVLSLTAEGLMLSDQKTTNETELNGCAVKGKVAVPVDRPSELDIGKTLRLRLLPFLDGDDVQVGAVGRYAELGPPDELWRLAEKLKLHSMLIQRMNNMAEEERYLVVYRWANLGCGAGNEVILPAGCPDRRCMRILRLGGQFWLESLTNHSCLHANEMQMARNTVCPLGPGTTIGCSHASLAVELFKQVGV